jgi:hypothetical protein
VRNAVGKHEPEIETVDAAEIGESLERVARHKSRVVVERDVAEAIEEMRAERRAQVKLTAGA